MVTGYKKVVLLKGLEAMGDYEFRMFKSLLSQKLKLTRKMQENYDRIKIADLMEDKFQNDAGLNEIIAFCKDMPALQELASVLRKEKLKVKMNSKGKRKTPEKKSKQVGGATAQPTSRTKVKTEPGPSREAEPGPSREAEPEPGPSREAEPGPTQEAPLCKKRKRKVTKTNECEALQLPQVKSQLPEPSAASPQQTEGCPQTPHPPPSTPCGGSSEKKRRPTSSSRSQMPQMPETPSRKTQSPQVSLTTPSKIIQKSPMPGTPSRKTQSPQVSLTTPSKIIQKSPMPGTPSRKTQSPQVSLTTPSKIIQKSPMPRMSSIKTQGLPVSLTSMIGIQGPQLSLPAVASIIPTPQIPLTLSSVIGLQTSQMPLPMLPGSPQTSQMLLTTPSRSLQSHPKPSTPQAPLTKPSSSLETTQMLPKPSSHPLPTKGRRKTVPTEPSEEPGYHRDPKEVMVLKATEPFIYDLEDKERTMFHATVATETEFFRVKVFDINLRDKFTPKKVITISHYIGRNGFLEIFGATSVPDVNNDRKLEISNTLIKNATATPKIIDLCSKTQGTFVNGVFLVHKKNVRDTCTCYEIQDNTGTMEVVVKGRLTKIDCEEGDKLKLFCFELTFGVDKCQLQSRIHSYIKVIKTRKNKPQPDNPGPGMETLPSSFFPKREYY